MYVRLTKGATPNEHSLTIDGLTLHFSYETVICFATDSELAVCENLWSQTTGQHLNRLDGGTPTTKGRRLKREAFDARLAAVLGAR